MEEFEIPLFPLRTVLFLGGPLPLRVFEQRYLGLISRCLREESTFGVALIREGDETRSGSALPDLSVPRPGSFGEKDHRSLPERTDHPVERAHVPATGRHRSAVAEAEMLHTFNCGIGMVMVLDAGDVEAAQAALGRHGIASWPIVGSILRWISCAPARARKNC